MSAERNAFLKDAQRLAYRDESPNSAGEFKRISLWRTKMKYPLLRVEEVMVRQGPVNEEITLSLQAAVADHVVVQLQPGISDQALTQFAAGMNATVLKKVSGTDIYLVQLTNPTLDALPLAVKSFSARQDLLRYAEVDAVVSAQVTPNDPNFSQEWGLNNTGQTYGRNDADIDAPEAWNVTTGTTSITVAVIDTGVDLTHPDLSANLWTNPGESGTDGTGAAKNTNGKDDDNDGYIDDARGWNFYNDNNNPTDDNFHGTHVAGTIGAIGNNGLGVTGVAWKVKILPIKFLSDNGSGYLSDAVAAIQYATARKVNIMSNSWGGGGYSQALKEAIDAAARANILFVAAAGNDSSNNDVKPTYPASYACANIIAVAATDANDQLASFSNFGVNTVQVAAPGVGILSTFPSIQTLAMNQRGLASGYGRISGTSMATPHVSGAAVLALAQNPSLSMAQLRSLIIDRCDHLSGLAGVVQGGNRLNAWNLVNTAWQPNAAKMELSSYKIDDSEGNNDGFASPGETICLVPTLLNSGGQTATNVEIQLISQQTSATVLAPATIVAGTALPYRPLVPSTPFRVQLSTTLADNAQLNFDLVIRQSDGTTVHSPCTITVTKLQPKAEISVNFECGEMKADPTRNVVYLINKTDRRVMALDTNQGQISAIGALDGDPTVKAPVENGSLQSGQMALSRDGSKLYVALTADQKIQVFSLPDLTPLTTLLVDFSPESLAVGANDRLYASSTEYWGKIREVNPVTGQTVQTFDKGQSAQFYMHALLRTNAAGTRLYVAETGLYVVGGPGYIYEYDVTGTTAVQTKTHPCTMVYLKDFALDEQQQRLYTMHGGIYGVQVTNMTSGDYGTVWPLSGAYGAAVAMLPGDSVIYGASGDPYAGAIRKFNRTDGETLGDYAVGKNGTNIPPRGIAVTPNGVVVYLTSNWTGSATVSRVGVVGRSSLTVTNPPRTPGAASLKLSGIQLTDLEGNGDSIANAGEIVTLTPTIANTGEQTASGVTVELSAGTGATILSSASQSLTSIAGGASITASGYRLQLAQGLATGTAIPLTFKITWSNGQTKNYTYSLVIQADRTSAEITTNLQFGSILADQERNVVYVIDKRYMRLLVMDTTLGHVTQAASLAKPSTAAGTPPEPGGMAQSVDGKKLYVALYKSKMIQVFSLPDLQSLAVWNYDFEPYSLTTSAQNVIYCTPSSNQQIQQINDTTGAVISNPPGEKPSGYGQMLRNAAGTELYAITSQTTLARYAIGADGALTRISSFTFDAYYGGLKTFALDEAHGRLYVLNNDGKVTMTPLDGGARTSWPLASSWGSAVSYLPGSTTLLASTVGTIRRLSCSNGATVQDYTTTGGGEVLGNALATTPNGRTVYTKRYWTGSSSADSVDGYYYWIGIIGLGSVDLDIPGSDPVVLKSVTLSDPAPGNADGYANPGETINLSPILKNVSDYRLDNVVVELLSSDPLAVVQASTSRSIGNVNGYVSFTPSAFSIALSSSLPDDKEIKLTFRITSSAGTQLIPYTLRILAPVVGETQVPFAIGEMLADRTRNLGYVIDNTNQRLIAVDTNLGVATKTVKLAGSPGAGRMTLSPDGSRLYVALADAKKIQSFNLPGLEQADIIDVDFSPVGIAAAADGKLYASSTEYWGQLRQIDPATGKTLGVFGNTYYSNSALKLNGDGTALYVVELGLSGYGQLDEYRIITGGIPVYNGWYPYNMANTQDLAVDDLYGRIYTMSGGVYGIGVTEMSSGVGTIMWPFGAPYGVAICFLPGSNVIYGGCGSPYEYAIYKFDRATGQRIGRLVPPQNGKLMTRGMVITANGRILYAKSGAYYTLGVTGRSTLTINPPTPAPTLYLGKDQTVRLSDAANLAVDASDSGSLSTTWTVVNGPKGAFFDSMGSNAAASFSTPGTYRVRATVSNGTLKANDEINITVLPDPASISVTAPSPVAIYGMATGQVIVTRTGIPSGNLTVSYTVSGTAQAGIDYTALPSSIVIPDGSSFAAMTITPLRTVSSDRTVIVQLNASSDYTLGFSQQATATLKTRSFDSWREAKIGGVVEFDQTPTGSLRGDGISNLMKYALQIDPLHGGVDGLPATNVITKNGSRYLTLEFKRLRNVSDIVYQVEVSSDMKVWNSGTAYTTELSAIDNGDQTETVTTQDKTPMDVQSARFIRLKVVSP